MLQVRLQPSRSRTDAQYRNGGRIKKKHGGAQPSTKALAQAYKRHTVFQSRLHLSELCLNSFVFLYYESCDASAWEIPLHALMHPQGFVVAEKKVLHLCRQDRPDRGPISALHFSATTLQEQKGCFNPAWSPQLQLHCQGMYLQADKLTTTSLKFQAKW